MSQAIEFNLYLYSDDSCKHSIMRKSLKEKRLTKDLINICDWFVDNKLSIQFGEYKTKLILFIVLDLI